ncbi:MAG: hypothetical protein E2577_13645 [Starkeya sp.]|nr:hypothetical protein [Starkeya sp.]
MSALPSLKFEPHNGFGGNDPDGNPWPLGFITAGSFPVFELQDVMGHPKAREIAVAMSAASEMLEALKTTAGNIRSLGPAGALSAAPFANYREWLAVVEAAIARAEGRADA